MNDIPLLTTDKILLMKRLFNTQSRRKENRILVEGVKCCNELLNNSKYKTDFIVINSESTNPQLDPIISQAMEIGIHIFQVQDYIFKLITETETPQGIVAVAFPVKDNFVRNKSFLLLDNIQDPGNVGTIIRTAEWFGINQIIFYENCVDRYSTKVIRSTMGAIFRMNMIHIRDKDLLQEYIADVPLYAASLDGKIEINKFKPAEIYGLVVGNESRGISPELKEIITKRFYIKGFGDGESLNVAIATGISLFHFNR